MTVLYTTALYIGLTVEGLMYAAVLVHNFRQRKYQFVTIVGCLGIALSVISIIAYCWWNYLWVIGNPLIFTQYWIFACQYSKVAFEMPFIVEEEEIDETKRRFWAKKNF